MAQNLPALTITANEYATPVFWPISAFLGPSQFAGRPSEGCQVAPDTGCSDRQLSLLCPFLITQS